MGLKSWIVGKVIEREIASMKKEGKMAALWRFLDGKKRLLGGALSALALLASFLTDLGPVAHSALGPDSKVVVYVLGAAGFLTWLVGALHAGWKFYYHEERP
jgi:hypothetical protein